MRLNLIGLVIGILGSQLSFAQGEKLNADVLVKEVLKNNFGVRISEQNLQIAQSQNNVGSAGLLPTVSLNAGGNYSNNNSELSILGQPEPIEILGAEATQLNAGLAINYTLFNGFAGKNSLKRLEFQESFADVNKRIQIELAIVSSLQAYYSAAGLQQSLEAAKQSLEISRNRLLRAKLKYEYGGQSRLDYLSAQVDFNNDSTNFLNAQLSLRQAKRQLNYLMDKEVEKIDYELEKEVEFQDLNSKEDLLKKSVSENSMIRNAKMNILIAEQDVKIVNSAYYPRVNLNAGYNYVNNENEAGVLTQQVAFGLNAGLSLSYNLFAGNQRKINSKVAQLRLQSQVIQEEDAKSQVSRDIENAWDQYTLRKQLKAIESSNLETAKLNFQRTSELFKLGSITNVQFRDAQLNLLRSSIRSIQANYDLKLAEIELTRISGQILQ